MVSTYGIKKTEILDQIRKEKTYSENALDARRSRMQDMLRLYIQRTWDKEIYIQYIYAQLRQLLSVLYSDEIQVQFMGYDVGDQDAADKRTKIAEFDYSEMEKQIHDYAKLWDRIFFGVGIEVFDGRDSDKNVPIISTRSPLTWLPDPKGWLNADKFRRHGFQSKITKEEAEQMGFGNIEKLEDTTPRPYGEDNDFNNITEDTPEPSEEERAEFNIYHHYTKIGGDIYLVSTDDACTTIFRMSKISEVIGKNVFPIVLSYFSPQRHDPFGVCLVDLSEDKQKEISKLLNLALQKAERDALGTTFIFDNSAIDDAQVEEMKQKTEQPRFINAKVSPGKTLNDIVTTMPTETGAVDAVNLIQQIDFQNRISTGIDPINMGIQTPGSLTATEAQQLQSNANLVFALTNGIGFRGEKDFRHKRFLFYKENLDREKVIRISVADDISFLKVNKSDLNTKYDPDIRIASKSEEKKNRQRQLQSYAGFLPYILQQGWYAATRGLRKLLDMIDVDPEMQKILVPQTADEIKAKRQVVLLNNNEQLNPDNMQLDEDHDTYIAVYKTAIDTPAKFSAIQARLSLKEKKEREMTRQQQEGLQQQVNATQAQMTAKATEGTEIESAADAV